MSLHSDQSRHLRQRDILDRQERAQFREDGVELAPRWRAVLGPTPILAPADVDGAKDFLHRIDSAIRAGGWTKQERNGLKRLRRKWERKAAGKSEWFNRAGNPLGGDLVQYYGDAGFGKLNAEEQEINALAPGTIRLPRPIGGGNG